MRASFIVNKLKIFIFSAVSAHLEFVISPETFTFPTPSSLNFAPTSSPLGAILKLPSIESTPEADTSSTSIWIKKSELDFASPYALAFAFNIGAANC